MAISIIRVGIADDHAIVRAALRLHFRGQADMCVAGEAATGRQAIDLVRATAMDVLIMDISMPDQSGLDALPMIRAKAPGLGVLMFSAHSEEQYAVTVLKRGAAGYLSKDCEPARILDAVRIVAQGRRYLSPRVGELLAQTLGRNEGGAPHTRLTNRELQVFLKLANGTTSCRIAEALSLSAKSVSAYRSRILKKLGMHSNADLTYYAVKNGLIR